MYQDEDFRQFRQKGIQIELIDYQLRKFREGFPYIDLVRPATPGDGIRTFNEKQIMALLDLYDKKAPELNITKFVPASGAATRMFKNLFQFVSDYTNDAQGHVLFFSDHSFNSVYHFIAGIANFAFYQDLASVLKEKGHDMDRLLHNKEYNVIINFLLNDEGLGYGKRPKALILFHQYDDAPRHAFEEHLVEGASYCRSSDNLVHVHFTVSPEHRKLFKQLVDKVISGYENEHGVSFRITFSEQKPSTDTIAVDLENRPFRDDDGSILFRPGGHGALIENLDELDSDVIFIKNIDNIVPDHLKEETYTFKKVIGGLLLQAQEQTYDYLRQLDEGATQDLAQQIAQFAREDLNIPVDEKFDESDLATQVAFLKERLNRPIRVCGMVRNEGEPGGGPFWVRDQHGEISLQIVETSQINPGDQNQHAILQSATHFNPVDLVCGVKDYMGNKFDLHNYIDPSTGFISIKSKDGRELKAQELPGLWNGAMASWNTIFIEVPIITFNPVKTVNDLLRETHQQ